MLCDKIFRAVWKPNTVVIPEYLDAALKTPHLRKQIENALTGSSPTMKNISKPALLALRLPVPPLDVQQALVKELAKADKLATDARKHAEQVKAKALAEVEAAILGIDFSNS